MRWRGGRRGGFEKRREIENEKENDLDITMDKIIRMKKSNSTQNPMSHPNFLF